MDQKFISGNFLPPPLGYPPIALLNNGHLALHPAVRTSPLTFSITPAVCWKDVSLKFCSLFPGLKLVSSRQEEGWEVGGGRGNTSFLHQSSLAGSSGAVLTGQHSRLTDLPATPPFSPIPHPPPKYSPQFPSPHQHILLSSQKAISPIPHPLDPFLEKLETAPTSKAIGAGVLLKLDPS